MATFIQTRSTKYLQSNTSSPYFDGDYYCDARGQLSLYYELNSAKNAYIITIEHKVQSYQDINGTQNPFGRVSVSAYINDNFVATKSGTPNIGYQTYSTKTLGTSTYTVPLNADGSCSIKVYCSTTGLNKTRTWTYTYTLPTVNVSSTIYNNSGSGVDFGTNITFTISRPNTSVTHTLTYSVGGVTYTIGSGVGDSITYAFPTSLINNYPNNANVSIWVNCASSNGTSCGTTVYLNVPASYKPTISLAISDVGSVPTDWGIWLKAKSKIKGVITASGIAGSSISSYSSSANGASYNTQEFTTDVLKNSGSVTISSTVTDSRNRPASTSQTISVVDYFTPTITSFSVVRCTSDGTEDEDGTYGKIKCSYSIAPIQNGTTSEKSVEIGDDLSGKTIKVSFSSDFISYFNEYTQSGGTLNETPLFSSSKYDFYVASESGNPCFQVKNKSGSAIQTISYTAALVEADLPSDFGEVTFVPSGDTFFTEVKREYIKLIGLAGLNQKKLKVVYGTITKEFILDEYEGTFEASASDLFSNLATSSKYNFEFYLIDYFEQSGIKYSYTMPPSFTTISYFHGGKGITIGRVAIEEGFNIYMETKYKDMPLLEYETVDEWEETT